MSQTNDCKHNALAALLGKSGHVNDLWLETLAAGVTISAPEFSVLGNQVVSGSGALENANTDEGKTQINKGVVEVVPAGTVRVNDGWMVHEPGVEQKILQTEDLSAAPWSPLGVDVTPNYDTAPNGETTASLLVEDTSDGAHRTNQTITPVQDIYNVYQVFLKKAAPSSPDWVQVAFGGGLSGIVNVNLSEKVLGNVWFSGPLDWDAYLEPMQNGWIRCVIKIRHVNTDNSSINIALTNNEDTPDRNPPYIGDGISGVLVWGANMTESALFNYIPNHTDTPVTTTDDAITCPLAGNFDETKGWAVMRFKLGLDWSDWPAEGNELLLAVNDSAGSSVMYRQVSNACTYDGTTGVSVGVEGEHSKEKVITLATIWNVDELEYQIGASVNGGEWDWSDITDFDGAYIIDTAIGWFTGANPAQVPAHARYTMIGQTLPPTGIEGMRALIEAGIPDGTQINDMEYRFLLEQGVAPQQLNDMWYEYLSGLPGAPADAALTDLFNWYWCTYQGGV